LFLSGRFCLGWARRLEEVPVAWTGRALAALLLEEAAVLDVAVDLAPFEEAEEVLELAELPDMWIVYRC
jgi:hypothetical protein